MSYRYIYQARDDGDWEFLMMLGDDVPPERLQAVIRDHFSKRDDCQDEEGIEYIVCEHPSETMQVDVLEDPKVEHRHDDSRRVDWLMGNRVHLFYLGDEEGAWWFQRLSDDEFQIWRDGCVATNYSYRKSSGFPAPPCWQ